MVAACPFSCWGTVALRKESVDRNLQDQQISICPERSLSARRAWIEIIRHRRTHRAFAVALRKESVDRNTQFVPITTSDVSLSARRAWIEIWGNYIVVKMSDNVALRKESVDRNHFGGRFFDCAGGSLSARRAWIEINLGIPLIVKGLRRSPQGERG